MPPSNGVKAAEGRFRATSGSQKGRITSVTRNGQTVTYAYNGLDTRTSVTMGNTVNTFLRDGAYVTDPVLVDSGATYTPGISERRGMTTTYLHSGLKNAFAQSGAAQTVAAVREYDAFGNVTSSSGAWAGPFGYAGKFGYQSPSIPGTSTPDEGLKLMGHRYYDPSTGRFLTRDPIFDGRNWYSYGGGEGNPLTGADPTGLAYLVFNGSSLTLWSDNGKDPPRPIASIPAVSGKPGSTSFEASIPGFGPIPPGQYFIDPTEIGWNTFPPFGTDFFASADAWGAGRVPIHPKKGTVTHGRDGFMLHGGTVVGSAGCIDVGHATEWFLQLVLLYSDGKPMTLVVQYPSAGTKPIPDPPVRWPIFRAPFGIEGHRR